MHQRHTNQKRSPSKLSLRLQLKNSKDCFNAEIWAAVPKNDKKCISQLCHKKKFAKIVTISIIANIANIVETVNMFNIIYIVPIIIGIKLKNNILQMCFQNEHQKVVWQL
jgi:hypothetical protein